MKRWLIGVIPLSLQKGWLDGGVNQLTAILRGSWERTKQNTKADLVAGEGQDDGKSLLFCANIYPLQTHSPRVTTNQAKSKSGLWWYIQI